MEVHSIDDYINKNWIIINNKNINSKNEILNNNKLNAPYSPFMMKKINIKILTNLKIH